MSTRKKITILILSIIFFSGLILLIKVVGHREAEISNQVLAKTPWWEVQSIDTMKFSRDVAREKINDPSFDAVIDDQVKKISQTGATHVAIGTPYDQEFLPFLKRWVKATRKYKLNVWFRGNLSGWENWFDYPYITPSEHQEKIKQFIIANPDLFKDGDLFTSCPECENGQLGDPRITKDVIGYRQFLINEYNTCKTAFKTIDKQVRANYYSMNGDIAKLIMDKPTTNSLDGLVVIDHYVASPDQLVADINYLLLQSGGQLVLGEMGVPIPDINGEMSEEEQSQWLDKALDKIILIPQVIGINYWTNTGSSTQLWNKNGQPRKIVSVINKYYKPKLLAGKVVDQTLKPIYLASLLSDKKQVLTDKQGVFSLPYINDNQELLVTAKGYQSLKLKITQVKSLQTIKLQRTQEGLWYKLKKYFLQLFFKS